MLANVLLNKHNMVTNVNFVYNFQLSTLVNLPRLASTFVQGFHISVLRVVVYRAHHGTDKKIVLSGCFFSVQNTISYRIIFLSMHPLDWVFTTLPSDIELQELT